MLPGFEIQSFSPTLPATLREAAGGDMAGGSSRQACRAWGRDTARPRTSPESQLSATFLWLVRFIQVLTSPRRRRS